MMDVVDEPITANSVLPARREPLSLTTADGLRLVGEVALPLENQPRATIVCVHPLPTHGGMMDSHVLRKMAWRLPAMSDIAVLRFNTRGTASAAGASEGEFDSAEGEGLDLRAAIDEAQRQGLPDIWLVGWSFGTDVVLKHGNVDPVRGAILLSPPLRFATVEDVRVWQTAGRRVVAFVPEFDDLSRAVHIAGIKGSYQVKTKTPDWQGKTLDFGVNSDGTLLFSEESPDSHRQMVNYGEETDVKAVE